MLEILKYVTSSFWVFIACFSLLYLVVELIENVLKAIAVMVFKKNKE